MKKKVLFMVINMNVGGTEKALLNMISVMPKQDFDITILMLEKHGGFLKSVPDWVNIKYFNDYKKVKSIINDPPLQIILNFISRGKLYAAVTFLFLYISSYFSKDRSNIYKYVLKNYSMNENFDVAIAYAGPMDFISFFVANKVNATRKYQWIHFDVTKIGFNQNFARKVYKNYHKIFVVSEEGKNKLVKILPCYKEKIETFLNILVKDDIQKMAEEGQGFTDNFDGLRILTVGRLSIEKGQDLTISVLAKLKEDGYNVRWYCLGEGKARNEYEKLIKEYELEKDYILLGSNPNPYKFMKQCDLYVQPSRHEGYCITLAEAKCLGVPIVSTNFNGAKEQIKNRFNGLIVDFDEDQMYDEIKVLLEDHVLRQKITENTKGNNLKNTNNEFKRVWRIMDTNYSY